MERGRDRKMDKREGNLDVRWHGFIDCEGAWCHSASRVPGLHAGGFAWDFTWQ